MKNLVNLMKVVLLSFLLVACKSPTTETAETTETTETTEDGLSSSAPPVLTIKGALTENESSSGELEVLGQVENTGGAAVFIKANCAFFDAAGSLLDTAFTYIDGSVATTASGVTTDTALYTGETGTFKIFTNVLATDVSDTQCTFSYDLLDSDVSVNVSDAGEGALATTVNNKGEAGGVWRGIFTPSSGAESRKFYKVLIAPGTSGTIIMLSDDESSLTIQGSDLLKSTLFSQSEDDVRMSFSEYEKENATDDASDKDGDGFVDDDINYGVSFEVVAQLTPKNKIEGTYTRVYKKAGVNTTEAGSVLFEYDPKYERGDRVNFYYTNNTFWNLDKAINSGAGKYSVAFGKGGSFSLDSMETAGLWFTYITDAVGSDSADEAFTASETAVTSAFLVEPAEAAATAAESAAAAAPSDTELAAAAVEARVAATAATADADRDLQLAINAVNTAIATGKAASDPGAIDLVSIVEPADTTFTETQKAISINIEAGNVVSALTEAGEPIEFVEQLINLPENATLISWRFPVDSSDTEGCNYKGNFDLVDPKYFIYNITFDVTGGACDIAGVYTGLAAIEEEYLPLDGEEPHPHTHYKFMTFGLANTDETINKTINNRLTLNFFGQ